MKKHCLLLILITCSFLACKKNKKTVEEPEPPTVAENKFGQSYGSDAKQKFDIYLPANRTTTSTPVLFLVHGGGWSEGDRVDLIQAIDGLKTLFPTYAFVNLSYRLYANGQNKFPTQELDVKTCIENVLTRKNEFKISDKFSMIGFSAGAHLSLLYAYKYGPVSFRPRSVVSFFGPTDLCRLYDQGSLPVRTLLTDIAGNRATSDSTLYISSSPVQFINQNSSPTLIFQGSADDVVPYQQAEILNNKLLQSNVVHEYKLYPNEGHGFTEITTLDAIARTQAFIVAQMN